MSTDTDDAKPSQPQEEITRSRHERRRRQTRERIANTALTLFVERGYDAVTIAEIAEAADVAKQTVVNHFPAKEDLLLAWHRPVEADVIDMIDQLPLSTPLPEFLKEELPRLFTDLPELPETPDHEDPRAAVDERLVGVFAVIQNSPTLQDALRLRGARYQEDLAAILADRVPVHLGPVAARAIAAFILTTVTAMIEEATRLRGAGRSPEQITADLTDRLGRALDVLHTGIGSVGGRATSSE
ncbi:TetR/AcrR family transcriptional regulator [Streptosporangium carneum]|uniref:TetR family transcriptional regulator n=1 Tax=Streptosporangium carneum TaxID=47481 RepID=A0A9W6MCD0_9ACTN|nr:TetR/AcrR family transcriptional regulator [Streptosporangium carneum]GLK08907.1 TetR family transcriptional regulator [Streptosporangium carneum]